MIIKIKIIKTLSLKLNFKEDQMKFTSQNQESINLVDSQKHKNKVYQPTEKNMVNI